MIEIRSYTWLSWLHIAAAVLAMVLGLLVLMRRKGTRSHRQLGYGYVASMTLLNLSAFGMYRLFGVFGPFHIAAVVSTLTLAAGMRAVLKRPRTQRTTELHLVFMYWSVIGLYAAFFSELMVRVRVNAAFLILVSCATGGTVLLGALMQRRLITKWVAELAPADHASPRPPEERSSISATGP
ncbi:MAG: DUF2306 domain-containing protein [Flavobacteriales bacterium]|nr:MAG: DUF2306 domain-containing protein [Flavobacteriales bacterium]